MPDTLSLATLDRFVGQELGASQWVRIDQQRVDKFAECTGDRQWIHVDVARAARESPYGGTIAHGYLTLSTVGPAQLEVWVAPAGIGTALHYGLDRVRFLAPVPVGRNVRTRIKLLATEEKDSGRTLVTTENTVEIEGQEKPALIATALTMVMS
jgi:acyl dehydratase